MFKSKFLIFLIIFIPNLFANEEQQNTNDELIFSLNYNVTLEKDKQLIHTKTSYNLVPGKTELKEFIIASKYLTEYLHQSLLQALEYVPADKKELFLKFYKNEIDKMKQYIEKEKVEKTEIKKPGFIQRIYNLFEPIL